MKFGNRQAAPGRQGGSIEGIVGILSPVVGILGLDRAESRIVAYMYLFCPVATQEQIESELGMARSAVSVSAKSLERFGYIEKARNGKTYQYSLKFSPEGLFLRILEAYKAIVEPSVGAQIRANMALMPPDAKAARRTLEKRLEEHRKIARLISRFESELREMEK